MEHRPCTKIYDQHKQFQIRSVWPLFQINEVAKRFQNILQALLKDSWTFSKSYTGTPAIKTPKEATCGYKGQHFLSAMTDFWRQPSQTAVVQDQGCFHTARRRETY